MDWMGLYCTAVKLDSTYSAAVVRKRIRYLRNNFFYNNIFINILAIILLNFVIIITISTIKLRFNKNLLTLYLKYCPKNFFLLPTLNLNTDKFEFKYCPLIFFTAHLFFLLPRFVFFYCPI